MSFGILFSWAVEKWLNEPLYEHGKLRKQAKQSGTLLMGHPVTTKYEIKHNVSFHKNIGIMSVFHYTFI